MKTETETTTATAPNPKPGNMTTRDLAKSLMKAKPATTQTTEETDGAEAETEETTREQSPPGKGKSKRKPTKSASRTAAETETDSETTEETDSEETTETTEDTANAEQTAEADDTTDAAETDETAETDDTEAETETDTEEDADPKLPKELEDAMEIAKADGKKGVAQLLKRVKTLVDQRDTERNGRLTTAEENAQLRAELQAARNGKSETRNGSSNGFTHPEVARVTEELANVDHWLGFIEDSLPTLEEPDQVVEIPNGKGGKIRANAQQLTALQRDLQTQRTELVAERKIVEKQTQQAWNDSFKEHHAVAVREFPWLKNPNSPEHQQMQAILKVFPAFKQSPDYELAIGDFLAGKALREARAKTKGAATTRKAPPSREPTKVVTDAPGGGANREASVDKEVKAAEAQFKKTGKTSDLAKLNAAKARAHRASSDRSR